MKNMIINIYELIDHVEMSLILLKIVQKNKNAKEKKNYRLLD